MPFDNRELQQCNVQIQRRRTLAASLPADRQLSEVYKSKLTLLEKSRDELEKKIENLSGGSLVSGWRYGIVFNKSARLDELRAKQMTVTAEYQEAARIYAGQTKKISDKEMELASLKGCEENYQSLLRAKKEQLLLLSDPESEELARLDREFLAMQTKSKSLQQAIHSGTQTLQHLEKIANKLSNARGGAEIYLLIFFSLIGILILLSILSARRAAVAEARKLFAQAPEFILRFRTDLSNINSQIKPPEELYCAYLSPGRPKFKLESERDPENAYQTISRARDDMRRVLDQLNLKLNETNASCNQLSHQVESILLSSW